MARTKPWEVSDDLWERVRPLIPERPPHAKGGRPAADDRQMFAAIVYLVRTGIPWNAMPRERGASTPSMTASVCGRARVSPSASGKPACRTTRSWPDWTGSGKAWTGRRSSPLSAATPPAESGGSQQAGDQRSQLCEGHGLPLAVVLEAANRNDMIVAEATLDAIVIERPDPQEVEQHLCMDAAYDYPRIIEAVQERGYLPHVRPNWWNRNHGHPATPEQLAASQGP